MTQTNHTHIISYSGGMGSFITAKLVIDEYGPEDVLLLFADTFMEDQDLYRFMKESVSLLGVKFQKISDGRTPWEIFEDVRFMGNSRVDPCSRLLKRELIDEWISSKFTPSTCTIYVGIDYTEKHRIERLAERKLPWIYRAPMVERKWMLNTEQKKDFCISLGIKPPRLYDHGFAHNNCGGFCVKAGLKQFKKLLEEFPDRYEWHVQQERKLRESSDCSAVLAKDHKWENVLYVVGGLQGISIGREEFDRRGRV